VLVEASTAGLGKTNHRSLETARIFSTSLGRFTSALERLVLPSHAAAPVNLAAFGSFSGSYPKIPTSQGTIAHQQNSKDCSDENPLTAAE